MPTRDDYCPVAKTVEAVGDRWSLLVVREMLRGVTRFNELHRSLPGISRSVLAQRLRHLAQAGILTRRSNGAERITEYCLTEAGRELVAIVAAMNDWGVRWLIPEERFGEIDADGLMLWIRRHVVLDALPSRRVVIRFDLHGQNEAKRYWLVLRPGEASLCPDHPGFEEDLWVEAETSALYRVVLGSLSLTEVEEAGSVRVAGPPTLARGLRYWLRIH